MRFVGYLLMLSCGLVLSATELKIYIDADFSNYYESSRAIEVGILSSLEHNKKKLAGQKITVHKLDHRGNSRRSLKNIKMAAADPKTLAVFCGMHSPPVLANQKFINDNQLLLLNPWAAAAPITRSQSKHNYIFRLSLDDSTVGQFLITSGIKIHKIQRPYLLLEDTAWGKNNWKTLSRAINKAEIRKSGVTWFKWGLSQYAIDKLILNLKQSNADSIVLVGNAMESSKIVNAISDANLKIPIISHWGITGGRFYDSLNSKAKKYPLLFIQSSLDMSSNSNNEIIKKCSLLFPDDFNNNYIKSPSGFLHAYDLSSLLIEASQHEFKKRGLDLREAVKRKLETLSTPVKGLIKTYHKPFQAYSPDAPFSHEALNSADYRMAYYNDQGQISHRGTDHD
ncbi:ABC transporter substrate-binding protein [Lentisphaera profundi]|uniref:ABC transporter substrate-binding protein n=1 Tax=Lentisphaera profundi TaxID=1658616 RepID=A0ABY7VQ18_9BACT|nr:ABC transporter substrate-binding protein [Lentisphaera profundi]WDE95926.1 ABC transporter substrate-binding protein [Lentisphaera profundi]